MDSETEDSEICYFEKQVLILVLMEDGLGAAISMAMYLPLVRS